MNCPSCGASIDSGQIRCPHCGNTIPQLTVALGGQEVSPSEGPGIEEVKKLLGRSPRPVEKVVESLVMTAGGLVFAGFTGADPEFWTIGNFLPPAGRK